MKVNIINRQNEIGLDWVVLKKAAKYVADKFNSSPYAELNIVLTGEKEIEELNKKYRDTAGPTDVLSFSYLEYGLKNTHKDTGNYGEVENRSRFLKRSGSFAVGEIIISPEIALKNIKKGRKKDPCWNINREITLLLVHGILHIYDYDHDKRQDRIEMENIQRSILNDLLSNFAI